MNKTPKPEDLFDEEPVDILRREIDQQVINEILHALGGAREPTKSERQVAFIDSLPENAKTALEHLRIMYGAPSLAEMIICGKPRELHEKVRNILMLDLERIWSAWHNA